MTINPAQHVLDAFLREAGYSADAMRNVLGYAVRALRGAVEDEAVRKRHFGRGKLLDATCKLLLHLADEVEAQRSRALVGQWNFSDQSRLENVMIDLRALPVAHDSVDSDNPVHNTTVWIIDAIRYGAILARVNVTAQGMGSFVTRAGEANQGPNS